MMHAWNIRRTASSFRQKRNNFNIQLLILHFIFTYTVACTYFLLQFISVATSSYRQNLDMSPVPSSASQKTNPVLLRNTTKKEFLLSTNVSVLLLSPEIGKALGFCAFSKEKIESLNHNVNLKADAPFVWKLLSSSMLTRSGRKDLGILWPLGCLLSKEGRS